MLTLQDSVDGGLIQGLAEWVKCFAHKIVVISVMVRYGLCKDKPLEAKYGSRFLLNWCKNGNFLDFRVKKWLYLIIWDVFNTVG